MNITTKDLDKLGLSDIIHNSGHECVHCCEKSTKLKLYYHKTPTISWVVEFCKECAKKYKGNDLEQKVLTTKEVFYLRITGKL